VTEQPWQIVASRSLGVQWLVGFTSFLLFADQDSTDFMVSSHKTLFHRRSYMPRATMFEIDREGATIIVTPTRNLCELETTELNAGGVVDVLRDLSIKNLVMDFQKTDYFGSSSLALFVKLWKMLMGRNGCMAFCNLSQYEHEILNAAKLDKLWPICKSREMAMKEVG
jgi:anti-anti-sigma factor